MPRKNLKINYPFFQERQSTSTSFGEESTACGEGTGDETPTEGDGRLAETQEVIIFAPFTKHRSRVCWWECFGDLCLFLHARLKHEYILINWLGSDAYTY